MKKCVWNPRHGRPPAVSPQTTSIYVQTEKKCVLEEVAGCYARRDREQALLQKASDLRQIEVNN
jgi:hypothetical protein